MKQIEGIWLPDSDEHFAPQLAASPKVDGAATYQLHKFREALRHIARRRCALDIGAHVGLWTRAMAKEFAEVVAFEPLAEHGRCWRANCAHLPNARLVPGALGEGEGKITIRMPADNTGHAHVAGEGEECLLSALDGWHIETPIDFVKIDVEGYELDVLFGARKTIEKNRPAIIVEQKPENAERYGRRQHDGVRFLKSLGYHVVWNIGGDHLMVR